MGNSKKYPGLFSGYEDLGERESAIPGDISSSISTRVAEEKPIEQDEEGGNAA